MAELSTILIVDDQAHAREVLEALLAPEGYRLLCAASGPEALVLAQDMQPDLVLLDVMMPEMDGFTVCAQLRANPRTAAMPVVLVTALDDDASRIRGIASGADDFLAKPFDTVALRARVRMITRLNRYRLLLDAQARSAALFDHAPDGSVLLRRDGTILLANPALERLAQPLDLLPLTGRSFVDLVVAEHRYRCLQWLDQLFDAPDGPIEIILDGRPDTRSVVELVGTCFVWDGQRVAQVVLHDMTDRRKAELLEEAQRHMAADLHDSVVPLAVGLHQRLQAFAHHHLPRSLDGRSQLVAATQLAQGLVRETRRILVGLRPPALEDLGLAVALRTLIDTLCAEGWAAELDEALGTQPLPPQVELTLFRIASEGVANIRKHAGTTPVQLTVVRLPDAVHLELRDWGSGFDPTRLCETQPRAHCGLQRMRDRVALLGGQFSSTSARGVGTTLTAHIPLGPAV